MISEMQWPLQPATFRPRSWLNSAMEGKKQSKLPLQTAREMRTAWAASFGEEKDM